VASTAPSGQKSLEEFGEQLKQLVAANLAGNARLLSRLNDFMKEVASTFSAARPRETTEPAALLSRWLDFNLKTYSVLSTHGLALVNEILGAAESALLRKSAAAAETGAETQPRVELRLTGRPGERITSGFAVENHFDRPLAITFTCTDLTPATGEALPAELVAFEPANLTIPPHGEAVAQVAVVITSDFVVAQTYTTTIRFLGFDAKEVGLSITVLPPAEMPSASRNPYPSKSKNKRRQRRSR
jgi:hypothetical protein